MFTTIHSCRIHYEVKGSGKAMVLLHGWGQDMRMMQFIQDYFSEQYCVLNLDLPGFKDSEEPPTAWGIQEYSDALHALLEELKLDHPILIAHSFGARIAQRYAMEHDVSKMVLTGAAGIKARRGMTYYAKVATYKLVKHLPWKTSMGSHDFQQASSIMKGVLIRSVEEDLRPQLANIPCVTLLVWGEEDEATPLWMGKVMEKEMPQATLVVLERDDHFAYFHQPQRFLAILEHFL